VGGTGSGEGGVGSAAEASGRGMFVLDKVFEVRNPILGRTGGFVRVQGRVLG